MLQNRKYNLLCGASRKRSTHHELGIEKQDRADPKGAVGVKHSNSSQAQPLRYAQYMYMCNLVLYIIHLIAYSHYEV